MKIGSREWANVIVEGARAFDLELSSHHTDLFAVHARELVHWTQITNLTTITDPFEIAVKHFVDSLAPVAFIPPDTSFLLDIGSGGGFPGIAIKIVRPSLTVTLIDASRKKISFLKHVIRTLNLQGIEALHVRAEALADDPSYRRHFDFIVSRALSDLKSFVQQALPLLATDGVILALKGRVDQTQVEAVQSMVMRAPHASNSTQRRCAVTVEKYGLPFTQSKRSIIAIKGCL